MLDLPVEKQQFIARLEEVCEILGLEPRGRQTRLAERYELKQPSVRNWFIGSAMPSYEIMVDLCKRTKISFEWFTTGRGPKFIDLAPDLSADPVIAHLVHTAYQLREAGREYELNQLVKIGDTFIEPHPKASNGSEH